MDLIFFAMPEFEAGPVDSASLFKELTKARRQDCEEEEGSFSVRIDQSLTLNFSDWLQGSAGLGVRFVDGREGAIHSNVPLPTIRVHASLPESVTSYDPGTVRDRVAEFFGDTLPAREDGRWWYLIATTPQAFVFFQDTAKAVLTAVDDPETYVRVRNSPTSRERQWAMVPGQGFSRSQDPDDNDAWRHDESGTVLRVLFEQRAHPLAVYEQSLRQNQIISELRSYIFWAVTNATAQLAEMVRRLARPDWFILQSMSGDQLFWAYPPNTGEAAAERLCGLLAHHGINVVAVSEIEREKLLSAIDQNPAEPLEMLVSSGDELTTPIDLPRRTFWLSKEYDKKAALKLGLFLKMMAFKAKYELGHGYDLLHGRKEGKFASEELQRLLFDPLTFRGTRMLDIGFRDDRLFMSLRFRESSLASGTELSPAYILEFQRVEAEIFRLLSLGSANEPE
jgi:hypothetical protein